MNIFLFRNLQSSKYFNKKKAIRWSRSDSLNMKGVRMNTLKNNTIFGLERKYWYRRIAFIYLPFSFLFFELYTLVVNLLLALGLR